MLQTLFTIPNKVYGLPLFGFGLFAALWAAWCVAYAIWQMRRRGWSNDLLNTLAVMGLVELVLIYVVPFIMVPDPQTGEPGIAVRGYGVMLVLGIVAGVGLTLYRAHRRGVSADLVYSVALWAFVAGIVGARAFYVVEYWQELQKPTLAATIATIVNMTQGGLVVFGAFLGAAGAIIVFSRRNKVPLLALLDLTAPGMALGLAFGRIGCFCNGCCFGGACDAPWAVEFPAGSPPHVRQVEGGIEKGTLFGFTMASANDPEQAGRAAAVVAEVKADSPAASAGLRAGEIVLAINGVKAKDPSQARAILVEQFCLGATVLELTTNRATHKIAAAPGLSERSRPIHPAQLYASFDAFLLTLVLLAFGGLSRRDGETFALLITIHPISRFLLEEIRIDEQGMFGTQLSISQLISLGMLAAAVALWLWLERQPRGFAWPRGDAKL